MSDLGKNFVLFYLSVFKNILFEKNSEGWYTGQQGLVHRTARAGTQDREGWYTGQRGGWYKGQRRAGTQDSKGWYTGQRIEIYFSNFHLIISGFIKALVNSH